MWMPPSRILSRCSRSPTPDADIKSTVPCSSTPARTRSMTYSRPRFSRMTESMPRRCRRCPSINPAGPAPTIATCVRWEVIRREGCGSLGVGLPLERQEQRTNAQQSEHRERSYARSIDRPESRVLVRREVEVDGLPEEGIVGAEAMAPRRHFARHFIAVEERGEALAVERHHHLTVLDVCRMLARDRDFRRAGSHSGLLRRRHAVALR